MRTMHRGTVLVIVMLVCSCAGGPRGATWKPWLQDYVYREVPTDIDNGKKICYLVNTHANCNIVSSTCLTG